MKIITLAFLLLSTAAFAQDNSLWFKKIPTHISFGVHLGSLGLLKSCSVQISPSDKQGVIAIIKRTRKFDILGQRDKELASTHILPSDDLIGSQKYPGGPLETKDILSFGYNEGALVIEKKGSKTKVTIEELRDGELVSATCTI